jgi:hypothetical protein
MPQTVSPTAMPGGGGCSWYTPIPQSTTDASSTITMTRPESSYEVPSIRRARGATWSVSWFEEVALDGELSLLPALEVWVVPILDDPRVEAQRPPLHDLIVTLRTLSREGLTRAHIARTALSLPARRGGTETPRREIGKYGASDSLFGSVALRDALRPDASLSGRTMFRAGG